MEKTLEKRCHLRWVLKVEKEFGRKEKGQSLLQAQGKARTKAQWHACNDG